MTHNTPPHERILRLPEVKTRTGKGKSTIYEDIKEGSFPKPISLGGKSVGWIESEVNKWIHDRIAASRSSS